MHTHMHRSHSALYNSTRVGPCFQVDRLPSPDQHSSQSDIESMYDTHTRLQPISINSHLYARCTVPGHRPNSSPMCMTLRSAAKSAIRHSSCRLKRWLARLQGQRRQSDGFRTSARHAGDENSPKTCEHNHTCVYSTTCTILALRIYIPAAASLIRHSVDALE